jgi:hypothetical protein
VQGHNGSFVHLEIGEHQVRAVGRSHAAAGDSLDRLNFGNVDKRHSEASRSQMGDGDFRTYHKARSPGNNREDCGSTLLNATAYATIR